MGKYRISDQMCIFTIFLLTVSACLTSCTRLEVETAGPRVVCYHPYGCFEPFETSPDIPLPMSPKEVATDFILHTTLEPADGQEINGTVTSIKSSNFVPSKRTKIIVHGFRPASDVISSWVSTMTNAILANDDVNVIVVNWVKGAHVEYDQAVSNTRLVGAQIAHLLRTIMEVHRNDPQSFHIIGFSLGAHVAGFAGKELIKHDQKQKIGRITGLDPANPGFNFDNTTVRLDKTDAHFVDVIHTDISTVIVIASGLNRSIGHADFYPNGGNDQPGCNTWNSGSLVSAVTDMTVCDHIRAPRLFMDTINATDECDFAAYKCTNYARFKEGRCVRCKGKRNKKLKRRGKNRCAKMGYWSEPPNSKKPVRYYLQTSESAPYCAKHYQVQVHWRKGPGSTPEGFRGSLFVQLHGDKGSTKEFALNDGVTFHILAGKTSRFLVSHDCSKDIGNVDRVSFRWQRSTCWTYFFCPTELVYLKRIKVIDASEQKRYVFLPLEMDSNNDGRKDIIEVPAGERQDLFRKAYIRARHPEKLIERSKVNGRKPPVVPQLVSVPEIVNEGGLEGQLLGRSKQDGRRRKQNNSQSNSDSEQFLISNTAEPST